MLTVSDSFKQAMHQSTKSLRSKVVVDNTTINDNDGLISFSINSEGYLFGSAVSIASVKLLGTNYDLVGHDIELKTSTKIDQVNDTWEELSLGKFQIVEQQVDLEKGTTTLKCFDSLISLSKIPYLAGDLVFPNTIANIATQLATRHGLIIDETVTSLPNASQIIAQDPYAKISNLTYRDVLNEIAGATGTMAIIKNEKLSFRPAQKTSITDWTYNHLKKISLKPKYGPINALVLARTPQEDNITLRDEDSILHPSTKNILNIASDPRSYTSNIDYTAEVSDSNSIRIRCNIKNNVWASVSWFLPTKYMIAGKKYTLSYSKITGNRPEQMLVSVNCYRKEDKKRVFIKDMTNPNGDKVTFIYDPANFEGYYLSLHMSKNGNLLYTGEFDGVYHNICLAEESVFNGFEPFRANGLTDVKLANNEILDDNRQTLIQPILNAIKGFEFTPFEAQTEGHGYYQIGDKITLVNGKNIFNYKDPSHYLNKITPTNLGTEFVPANTNTANQSFISTLKIPIEPSKDYTISTLFNVKNLLVYECPGEPKIGASLSLLARKDNAKSITVTTKSTSRWLLVKFYNTWAGETNAYQDVVSTLQVEEGNVQTKYESFIKNELLITSINLEIGQGIKEILKGLAPNKEQTDYARAGGVIKKIYNTEIKVDKQNQEIKSIVEKTVELDGKIDSNYSSITQNINNIVQTVQTTGGNNLIKNSVGYGKDNDGRLRNWTYTALNKISSNTSPSSMAVGALSGHQINIRETTIEQRINVTAGSPYTISFRVSKPAVGSGFLELRNELDSFRINLSHGRAYDWSEEHNLTFVPSQSFIDLKILSHNALGFSITDLMLSGGDARQPWKQSAGEIYNTQVSLDSNGVKVRSNVYDGDYVEITPLGLAGYSNVSGSTKRVFGLNRDVTESDKLSVNKQIEMRPFKIVPINNGNQKGWAFVGID